MGIPSNRKGSVSSVHVTDADARLRELAAATPPFYKNRNLLVLYLLIIPGGLLPSATLGFDSAMMNGLQAVPQWDEYFHHPRGAILGVLTAILSLGAICGTPFISLVADRFGRRIGVFAGSLIMGCGGILQGCSQNTAMFLVSRFIIGFGLVFANSCSPILVAELAHPKDRQVITSLYQTTWYLGATLAAWITFGTFNIHSNWSWRIPSLLQALLPLVQMAAVYFLPESPRWLLSKGKKTEARNVLIKYHANNNEFDEYVNLEFAEIEGVIAQETANKTSWSALWKTPGNRRRMLIIIILGFFAQWSGNGLIAYYLVRVLDTVGITQTREQNILNGSLYIFNWLTAMVSAILTAYLRRRTQFMISVCGMFGCFILQTLCAGLFNEKHNITAGQGVIPMLFLFYLFYNLAFNALLFSYPAEVLPFPIRAKGYSVLLFCTKSASFINAFVNPIGLKAIGWKFYFVYVGFLAFEILCVYLFIVETKGPSLEAIAEKFDGKSPVILIEQDGGMMEKNVTEQETLEHVTSATEIEAAKS